MQQQARTGEGPLRSAREAAKIVGCSHATVPVLAADLGLIPMTVTVPKNHRRRYYTAEQVDAMRRLWARRQAKRASAAA